MTRLLLSLGCLVAALPAQWKTPTEDQIKVPAGDRLLTYRGR